MLLFPFVRSVRVSAVLLSAVWLCFASPVTGYGADDLNKEFSEKFFQIRSNETDSHLRITRAGAVRTTVNVVDGSGPVQLTVAGSNASSDERMPDPSWVGRLLQIGIVLVLVVVLLFITRRSGRKKRRY